MCSERHNEAPGETHASHLSRPYGACDKRTSTALTTSISDMYYVLYALLSFTHVRTDTYKQAVVRTVLPTKYSSPAVINI